MNLRVRVRDKVRVSRVRVRVWFIDRIRVSTDPIHLHLGSRVRV